MPFYSPKAAKMIKFFKVYPSRDLLCHCKQIVYAHISPFPIFIEMGVSYSHTALVDKYWLVLFLRTVENQWKREHILCYPQYL